MKERYVIEYRSQPTSGQDHSKVSEILGVFYKIEFAEECAKKRFPSTSYDILAIRPAGMIENYMHIISRFIIRSLRITLSLLIAYVAYAQIFDSILKVGDTPFSELTLNMLISGLAGIFSIIIAYVICLKIGFGEAPENCR